ncbi:MAG: hypothetical protein WA718_11220 [Terriglobales bacterium]
MKSMDQVQERKLLLGVRPKFLAGCAAVVAVLILPDTIAQLHILKRVVLILAALAILAGWLLLLKDGGPKTTWRALTALVGSVYLVVSLPVFLFEMSQMRWLMRHPWHQWLSMYVRPWVHWGYTFVFLSVICSFLGRGRARIAFVVGSVLLLMLRFAMGIWVY